MAVSENNRKFAIGKQRLGIMVEINDRKLPVGIQSFEEIRKGGYLYVDKTDIIWQLANKGKTYNYLIRPRRFGKSVLVDTLESYFMGKKELFEGLKIMQMETEWVKRPVIRLDMSQAGAEPESLKGYLDYTFQEYESLYEIETRGNSSLATRLIEIIKTHTTKQVCRWPFSSMNMTLHCSIPGKLRYTKNVRQYTETYLSFSNLWTNSKTLFLSQAAPNFRNSP